MCLGPWRRLQDPCQHRLRDHAPRSIFLERPLQGGLTIDDFIHGPLKDNPSRWKYGHAYYGYHTPLEYEIVEKGEQDNWEHPDTYIKIRPLTIGMNKSTHHTLLFHDSGAQQIHLRDYQFWILRRMIRRGPTSWAIKKDRWVHKKTFDRCLGRAYHGKEEYVSPGWSW